ncbi:pilus assembly protein PilP [Aliiglaciecola sp. CAU 1673]|uniref:pilus assembly protein PilP n=1 Tax=Aliiglaciecola sp. CAU 1673 TaxID=3032595 RepID=UPI0023DBFF60|nr:pilus assembly protein PilP [Aliiglaciecola sp. CAU 1673]MDF2178679.1 pilus assembly protein PilP [Aliiglaciecola sp. CAU 1673]
MKIRLPFLLSVLSLAGCHAQMDDLQQHIAEVQQNAQVVIEPYPEFKPIPAFRYKGEEQRSPFQRPKGLLPEATQVSKANCLQPDFSRQKQPLERYGLDALSIKGFFKSGQSVWAMIQANDGSLHKARRGDHMGLFFGKITSIQDGKVAIVELLPDGTGCWQEKPSSLTIASQAGDENNV